MGESCSRMRDEHAEDRLLWPGKTALARMALVALTIGAIWLGVLPQTHIVALAVLALSSYPLLKHAIAVWPGGA